MNIRDFFWAYIDLWVESNKSSDPSTYDQCVDLWRVFNRKIIKAPDIFGNPPELWEKYQSNYYEKIPNTPEGVPQLGDVIVWGKSYGGIGHIAICTEIANKRTFTSFDQNDPINEPCHFQPHTYTGVLGWLRPKNQLLVAEPQAEEVETIPDASLTKAEAKVTSLKEQVGDISKALNMPMSEDGVEDMVGRIGELRTNEGNYIEFVKYVAKCVDSPEEKEEAVRKALASFEARLLALKEAKLASFGAWEKIASGIVDLISFPFKKGVRKSE